MLTPEQIKQIREGAGLDSNSTSENTSSASPHEERMKRLQGIVQTEQQKQFVQQPKDEGYFSKIANFIGGAVKSVGNTAMRGFVENNFLTRPFAQSGILPEKVKLPIVGETSLRYSDNPGTALKQGGEDLMNAILPGGMESKTAVEALDQIEKPLVKKILSRTLKGVKTGTLFGTVTGGVQGVGNAIEEGKDAKGIVENGFKGAGVGAIGGALTGGLLGGITGGLATQSQKELKNAIDAVKPDMKGKTLINHYLQDFGAGTQEAGLLKRQSSAPSSQVERVAENLKDVLTSKKPLQNLQNLGSAMEKTESKLNGLLVSDKTPVIKQHVSELVLDLKKNIPREFQAIKDQKNVFNHVIDYADELINGMTKESTGNLKQLREVRIKFDTQAKKEFPSAFKDGVIDVSTPGGRAIKLVRDTINDHLYEITPQGSELQRLIGREADIFKAAQNIAPKVAKNEGKSLLEKLSGNIKKHPIITAGVAGYGAYQIGKNVVK